MRSTESSISGSLVLKTFNVNANVGVCVAAAESQRFQSEPKITSNPQVKQISLIALEYLLQLT